MKANEKDIKITYNTEQFYGVTLYSKIGREVFNELYKLDDSLTKVGFIEAHEDKLKSCDFKECHITIWFNKVGNWSTVDINYDVPVELVASMGLD